MLKWPKEIIKRSDIDELISDHNISLDLHGNPFKAELTILSDGNHHMALNEALNIFIKRNHPDINIFYATTPPGPILKILRNKEITLGNLSISIKPDIFISPENIINNIDKEGYVTKYSKFIRPSGYAILVKKGNPLNIKTPKDIIDKRVNFFISNPKNEKSSYDEYLKVLNPLEEEVNFIYGESIHHREAPEAVYSGKADAAIVYYHLAVRYKKIFPALFDYVEVGNIESSKISSIALLKDSNPVAKDAYNFLKSEIVNEIYKEHRITHFL